MSDKTVKALVAISSSPAADWASQNPIVPSGVMVRESDTGRLKIGNGVDHYNDLEYAIDQALSEADKLLLDTMNLPGGIIQLDTDGAIPASYLPSVIRGTVVYVDDITARDLVPVEERVSRFFMVHNATDDPTVDLGGALYGWWNNAWLKIAEYESLDIDVSVFLNKETQTMDDILDGVQFVRMTAVERAKLAGIEAYATKTDADTVDLAGAMMYTHHLNFDSGGSAGLFDPVPDTVIQNPSGYFYMKDGAVATHPDDYKTQALTTGQTLTNGFYLLDLGGDGVAEPHFVDMEGTGLVTYGLLTVS